jgi:hypothetical protein
MSFADYSTTPASNTTIGGVSAAEGCPAGNINNICRTLAADGRQLYDTVAAINLANYAPLTGAVFTGNPKFTGKGGYWYHAAAAQTGGPVSIVPTGTARPASPAEGTVQFYY